MLVAINSFVRRQTPVSPYTHFDGTEDELLARITRHIEYGEYIDGYRDGVILVNIPADGFFTGLVELQDGDGFIGEYKARRPGETPRQSIQVKREGASKQPCALVQAVCYRHDVLLEDDDAETNANWEVVSLNGYPTDEIAPINPMVLMHNHFGSDGGTATNMNAEEFENQMRESFLYWRNRGTLA